MTLINKNMSSLRDQSATYRWAYYTPNPWALQEIAQLADQGKVSNIPLLSGQLLGYKIWLLTASLLSILKSLD